MCDQVISWRCGLPRLAKAARPFDWAQGRRGASISFLILALFCLVLGAQRTLAAAVAAPSHSSKHARTRTNTGQLAAVDAIIQRAITEHHIPGAVLVVGHDGAVVYRKAYGMRSLEPRRERMTVDTVFDLASLTKVVVTTTAVMQLFEQGLVRMNDPVAKYLPEFAQNGKEDITVRQLLTHFSGLEQDLDLKSAWEGKETAYQMACAAAPTMPPGSKFAYSDVNFVVLGALVERVSGQSLDAYAAEHIFAPLHMTRSCFNPPAAWRASIAPTQYDENEHMLWGEVHDPTARRMGGVAGQAGLFSTGDDLAKFAQALLDGGGGILSAATVEKMTQPEQPPSAPVLRGFGWDIDSPYSTNRGDLLPVGGFGHTGFTGTSIWIDPATESYIILLTNAVHPRGKGNAIALRSKVATTVAASLKLTASEKEALRGKSVTGYNEAQSAARRMTARNGEVKTGIDVLEEHGFDVLKPESPLSANSAEASGNPPQGPPNENRVGWGTQVKRKLGLVTNQTGVDASGKRTIDVLAQVPGVSLEAIFSPEHGVTGTLDTTSIGNTTDAATGIPVYSVYGAKDAERRPPVDVLKTLDAVVFDIQDAGARFYTYETTLGYFLEACAQAGVELIVLDRPNPILGRLCRGRSLMRGGRALRIIGRCRCGTA